MSLETWSDLAGLLSGFALLVTAWRNDGLSGFIDRLRSVVSEAKAIDQVDAKADKVLSGLESELGRWTWVDRWSLRVGALALLLAFVLKMIHNACGC